MAGYLLRQLRYSHQCTNVPATRKTWPPEVLNARPFCPHRTSRPILPFTLLMVMESISASVVRLNDCNVPDELKNDCVTKYARFAAASTPISGVSEKVGVMNRPVTVAVA